MWRRCIPLNSVFCFLTCSTCNCCSFVAECSNGCPVQLKLDDICQPACNNEACNFDNGRCTLEAFEMLGRARMTAVSGDRDTALFQYNETCAFLKDPVQSAQKLVRDSSCTIKELIEKGMDVFGASSNYVSKLKWTEYDNVIDSEIELLRTIEERMEKLVQQQQNNSADKTDLEKANKMADAMDEALRKVSTEQSKVDEDVGHTMPGAEIINGLRKTGQKARGSMIKNAEMLELAKKDLVGMPDALRRSQELVAEVKHRFSADHGLIGCATTCSMQHAAHGLQKSGGMQHAALDGTCLLS